MNANKVWSIRDGQGYFGFESIVAEANAVNTEVKRLKRFNQDGSIHAVSLEAWLGWYAPLVSSGIRVRELENCTLFVPSVN